MDHSKQASEIFDKHAELYQSKYMDVSAYAPELDKFLALLPRPDSTILEIACGPGNVARYMLNKNPSLDIFGIDLAPAMVELARLNCPEARFEVLDCRQVSSLANKYDGIIVSFCLPYLNKSESGKLVKDVAALLQPGGKLYLSTIEGAHEKSGYKTASTGDKVFLHYYELADLTSFFAREHLHIVSENRVSASSNPNNDIDLVLVGVKKNGL